jgi:hypothetical protein
MRLTLNQMSALDELWTKTDLTDADDPALELDQDFDGNVIVDLCRTGDKRNLHLGSIARNGTITVPPPAPEPKEVKAKRLRVGYGVWAEGAPQASRIHNIRRENPDYPDKIVAYVEWGHLVYDPDELVKVDAPVLHPQILDSTGTEFGLGSLIAGGEHPDGEVVAIVEPDESQWRVAVQWPEHSEPEYFDACSDPRHGYESEPLFAADIEAAS